MKITVEELSPILRKVEVEVPVSTVDKALDAAYRAVGKRARIKGFRPGKVPRRVLERYYGHDVAHEVAEQLVRDTWPEAVEHEKLEPVATPEVEEPGHVTKGAPWTYVAKVEVLPPIKVTAYQGLSGETLKVEVADTEIDGEIDRLREAMAQLVPVEDREEVQEGDYVAADVEATLEGEAFPQGSGEEIVFEVAEGEVTRGRLPEAAGRKVGEVVELDRDFEEDHPAEAVQGKSAHFAITLKQIRKKEMPAADDELAKDLGEDGVDSLLALRGHIRQRLLDQRKSAAERRLKDSLVKDLVEKNPLDVPASLVDRTAEAMIRPYLSQMMQAGMDPKALAANLDLTSMLAEARPSAELAVKGSLLLRAVADAEKLEVSDEDIETHFEELSKSSGQPVDKVKAAFDKDPDERRSLERRLVEDKALAFIEEKAKISEVEVGKETGEAAVSE
ncbi:MAG: trigger factor [Deltaproteobacteria bacterium]|nr:trigger factor [Deltaproteobacteria bacterium]